MRFATPLWVALEKFAGDLAFAVIEAGPMRWGVYAVGEYLESEVAVAAYENDVWRELARYEVFWDAMRRAAPEIDRNWEAIPISDQSSPIPVMVLPLTAGGFQTLIRTAAGVVVCTEVPPGVPKPDLAEIEWPEFTSAIEDLAGDFEMFG